MKSLHKLKGEHASVVFRSWIISNLCLLLLPIILGIVFYYNTISTITDEANHVNALSLRNLKYTLDSAFSELEKTVNTLSASKNVQKLTSISNPAFGANQRTILAVQDELSCMHNSAVIDEIYIYVKENCIVTCTNKYNRESLPSLTQSAFGMEYRSFLESFSSNGCEPLRIINVKTDNNEMQSIILYIRPLYTNNLLKPKGAIIIRLNSRYLNKLLDNLEVANQGEILLLNSMNEYCGRDPKKDYHGVFDYQKVRQAPEASDFLMDREGTTVVHIASEVMDIEYISVMKTDSLYHNVAKVQQQLVLYIIACFVVGSITAYLFAKRNYTPLNRLKRLLISRLNTGTMVSDTNHDYRMIEEALLGLLASEEKAKDIQKQNQAARINNLLLCLLKNGYPSAEQAAALLEKYDLYLDRKYFVVACVNLIQFTDPIDNTYQENENVRSLLGSMVQSMGKRFLNPEYFTAYSVDVDGMMAFIINFDEDCRQGYEQCKSGMEDLVAFAGSSLEMVLNISISDIHTQIHELSTAYSETLIVYDYCNYTNNHNSVICYDEIVGIHDDIQNDNVLNLSNQKKLINCLEFHDYATARAVLENALSMHTSSIISVQMMKIRTYALVNILLSTIDYSNQYNVESILDEKSIMTTLLNVKSNDEFCEKVRQIFNIVIEALEKKDAEKEPDFITEAERYVQSHYQDPNLSVSGIADELGISMAYLSRNFKHYRNTGLLNYIHKVRIDASKSLLSQMSVSEVAGRVGYLDDKSFIRVYKKLEGITPGKNKSCNDEL